MIIFNTLFFCLAFLLLFSLALWPILLKNSRYAILIFIGTNIVILIALIAFGSNVTEKRQKADNRISKFHAALPNVAAILENGTPPEAPLPCIDAESDRNRITVKLDEFNQAVLLEAEKLNSAAEKNENSKTSAPDEVKL